MFKVALSNFYEAKKSSNDEKKIKYYKILRNLFNKDLEFFAEVEKFIQFTGVIKSGNKDSSTKNGDAQASRFLKPSPNGNPQPQYSSSTPTKRKLNELN